MQALKSILDPPTNHEISWPFQKSNSGISDSSELVVYKSIELSVCLDNEGSKYVDTTQIVVACTYNWAEGTPSFYLLICRMWIALETFSLETFGLRSYRQFVIIH